MPSGRRKGTARRPAPPPRKSASSAKKPAARPAPKPVAKKPAPSKATRPAAPAKPAAKSSKASAASAPPLELPLPGGRRHVLSLSFVRDGDEFLARLETDSGQITELKNRSLDQLLTLVASELEDLLE